MANIFFDKSNIELLFEYVKQLELKFLRSFLNSKHVQDHGELIQLQGLLSISSIYQVYSFLANKFIFYEQQL